MGYSGLEALQRPSDGTGGCTSESWIWLQHQLVPDVVALIHAG